MYNILKPEPTPKEISVVVGQIMDGKTNNTGSVTLTESVASTVVTDRRIGPSSFVSFMPTTANAATELAGGSMYVSSIDVSNRTFTISHANNAQTDRTFTYTIIG